MIVLFSFSHRELEKMRISEMEVARMLVKSKFESLEMDVRSKLKIASEDVEWTRLLLSKNVNGNLDQLALIEKTTAYRDILDFSYVELISADSILIARSGDYSDFNTKVIRPALDTLTSQGVRSGLAVINIIDRQAIYAMASAPLFYRGNLIAYLQAGKMIDEIFLAKLEDLVGGTVDLDTDSLENLSFKIEFATMDDSGKLTVSVFLPRSDAGELLTKSLWLYAVLALAGIVLSGFIGYVSSRHLTVPIGELVRAAEDISKGKFEQRIIWFAKDELGILVDGFNSMYDRLKVSQEKLVQSEKIAAWNQMARKVAHEIKNPLTPIQLSIEDLKRSYDSHNPEFGKILDDAVETISSEIARLKRLTDEFSRFARLPAPEMKRKDIRPVITEALRIHTEKIASGQLRVLCPQHEIPVNIDVDLFSQALMNLVKNGFEASDDKGNVIVTVREEKRIVRILVEDDGRGIADDKVGKLFTPYFTTKKSGTGLGLVIAYRIVFDHGGRIGYEKRDPKGSMFIIVLPLAERIS